MLNVRYYWHKKMHYQWFMEDVNHSVHKRLKKHFLVLIAIAACHTIAMMVFEKLDWWNAFWLTMTTMTTVGYGDLSATTAAGQFCTIIFLYVGGITLLAQFAGEYIDYRISRREQMLTGHWRWKYMRDHLLIINTPNHDRNRYLKRLTEQIRKTPQLNEIPIQLLTTAYPNGLPQELRELGIVHYTGIGESSENLTNVNIHSAAYIFIIAEDHYDERSDSLTLDVLEHLQNEKIKAHIVAESVLEENRKRFRRIIADVVIRPVRAYPELVVRAMASPGTETILENLFTHQGDHPHRYDIEIQNKVWRDIAFRLLDKDLGIPLGYVSKQGEVITNPKSQDIISSDAIILMVRQEATPTEGEVYECIMA